MGKTMAMGFYFELHPKEEGRLFIEGPPPPVFWILYGIMGFALACMAGAAFSLLNQLASQGTMFDSALYALFILMLPVYLAIGIKLVWVRKFIQINQDNLSYGFRLGSRPIFQRTLSKDTVKEVVLVNQLPSANLAPEQHDDPAYYIRGHWMVQVVDAQGKRFSLDKHSEKGALEDLYHGLLQWNQT